MADLDPLGRRRRLIVATAVVLCAALLAAAVWTDVDTRARARNENVALSEADAHLASLHRQVSTMLSTKAATTAERTKFDASVNATFAQLLAINTQVNTANVSAYLHGVNIANLETCLGGIQKALGDLKADDNAAATRDISSVSAACIELEGGTSSGLVYPFDFPDPDVMLVGSTYYAYATNSVGGNIQIIKSSDLINWDPVGNALPTLPAWANADYTWAPSVALIGGKYELYYAVDPIGSTKECISVATSSSPAGPFLDTSIAPLECQPSLGGSIDPDVFVDVNGAIYLLWKSGGAGSSRIWAQPLDPTGLIFAANSSPTSILVPDQSWEAGTVEAPDLVAVGGRYFLFYSGNDWSTASYGVGVASCIGPLGPCSDVSPNPILSSGNGQAGPGGESVFSDANGHFWMAFAAWNSSAVGGTNSRGLYIRSVDLSGVPQIGAAP